ncbi:hypothetical protein [Dehalobacter restrictus]|uniref:Uncharacterized protein n=1 Tax=Dehalobacter restrictus TaxID=55583 RepID=A0A857DJI9_9FIRM|nr:hypothetical protein [Dehalobacter restrictus]QHA00525.1 hypothetical protein GQ588_07725 [Dehalobacter restrictus]
MSMLPSILPPLLPPLLSQKTASISNNLGVVKTSGASRSWDDSLTATIQNGINRASEQVSGTGQVIKDNVNDVFTLSSSNNSGFFLIGFVLLFVIVLLRR